MFCHLGTLWLPTWFSAKIFACDCSLGKTNVLILFSWLKTQERHAFTAIFLHLPWFSSYLQHCPKTENWLMIKRYHWVLQRGWNDWVLPSRYGVLLTFLRLNITRITLWNNFSGLCIKFRNKTWRQIRYLGQNITNLQISTFDANVTPGMRKKRHIISPWSQTELQDISSSKKPWINVFSGPKTSKMPLSSWDTGVQKFNERKSQNSILSLLRAFFIVRN